MEYHRQTIGSSALADIIDLPPSLKDKKVEIIVLPVENSNNLNMPSPKRQLGFIDVPPIPDSFFEPLPEEELQAWGL